MPVIVYKTLDLAVHYVQGRRVLCEYCRQPFTFVHGDRKTFNVTGIPVVSSDEGMRQDAMKQASKSLAKIARDKKKGEALCPHCKRYQGWMVSRSRGVGLGCGFLGGLAIAGFLAFVLAIMYDWSGNAVLATTAGGTALGLVLGKKWSLDPGPHRDREDQRALKDDEVPELLERCESEGYEPFLFWYLALGNETNEKEALISLGVADFSGRPPVWPREMSSDAVVRQLHQA